MNKSLDHIFALQGDSPGKPPSPPARRTPSWEIVVIAVSVALPLTIYCGRLIKQTLNEDRQEALAGEEPEQSKRNTALQVRVATGGENKSPVLPESAAENKSPPARAPDSVAPSETSMGDRVARPESSMGVLDAPAERLNSVPRVTQEQAPATPFAKPQGVPPGPRVTRKPALATAAKPRGVPSSVSAPRANPTPSPIQANVADHQHDEVGEFGEDGNVRMATPAGARVNEPIAPSRAVPVQAGAASLDLDLENALVNAWGLIERGDHDLGRRVLAEAGKKNKDDIRVDFSLGLLDALLDHNWPSAEKHFAECVRREPENTASINNLALARLRLSWDRSALRPWEVMLEQDSTPPEVLQNVGRVRQVLKGGRVPANPSLTEVADRLYLKASIASGKSSEPRTGFLFMPLTLADGRTVGWSEAKKYEDTWCTVCQGSGQMRCPSPACVRGMVKVPKLQGGGRTACNTCRGTGSATCNACTRGRDRSLTYYPSAPVSGPVTPATVPASSPATPAPTQPPARSPTIAAPPAVSQGGPRPIVAPAPLAPGLKK